MNKYKPEVIIDYCFNEFLKMCDFIKDDLEVDNKKFLLFILKIFQDKVNEKNSEELVALDHFPLPPMEKQETSAPNP